MHVIRVGQDAVLVEVADAATALDLALWARDRLAVREVVPAARTVLLDGLARPAEVSEELAGWTPGEGLAEEGDPVDVAVHYDGPDLAVVAEAWGIAAEQVPERHAEAQYVVAFCGFAPGFSYLTAREGDGPVPPPVPRRDSPRSRVEPGSVGLAGPFTGIYPTASPGGWQLIGRTDAPLWRPDREPPALLPPGTRVRFVPA